MANRAVAAHFTVGAPHASSTNNWKSGFVYTAHGLRDIADAARHEFPVTRPISGQRLNTPLQLPARIRPCSGISTAKAECSCGDCS